MKGKARIIEKGDPEFLEMEKVLIEMTGGNFPFATITEMTTEQIKPIIAPEYILYPEQRERSRLKVQKRHMDFNREIKARA